MLVHLIGRADGVVFLVKWDATEGDGGMHLPLPLEVLARMGFFPAWILLRRSPLVPAER